MRGYVPNDGGESGCVYSSGGDAGDFVVDQNEWLMLSRRLII